ncbi:MAG: hypothetical protein L6R40_006392 [Gallowayella cf. fulva]|nr:MAG: hypothetical protein L6R40_006392 [Xanthomendoza cf. fulva]
MTSSSSRFIATDIDPEDRIFDSSSSSEPSESSASSDNEELPESPSSAQQRLLLNLQQNVEDIRTNVAQLTRSIPQYRASSQISTISDQLSSIRRSLGTIRRHPPSRTRQHPTGQAMAARISTHGNSQSEGHHQGSDDSAHVPASGSFNLLNDEELRQHIDLLQSQMERAITDGSTRDGSNVAVATLRRIGRRLQQASQEVNRRRGISSAFGTLGEAGMQGQNYPSPLTSHFTPSAPGEEQDSHLVNYSTETQPQVADEDQRSSDSLRVLSGSDHNSTEGHGWPRREALGYPTASHSRAPPRSNASSTGAVDGSDPSTPRTTFLDSDGLYNSIFSGVPQARYESDYLSRLRVPRVNPEGSSSYSSQLPRPSSALSSIDGTGPRVWRHGPPREVPEAASANLAALGRPSLRYPRSPRSRELDFIIAARAQYPRNTVGRQSFTARASDGPDNPLASYSPEPNDFDGFFPDVGVLRRAQYPRATVGPQSSTAGISDEPVAPRTTNELNWMSAEEAAAENAAFLGQYPSLAQDPDRWMYHLGRPVVPGGRPERQQRQAQPSLDNDTTRPEPVLEEAKRVLVECKICFAQISNQAMLPCGE